MYFHYLTFKISTGPAAVDNPLASLLGLGGGGATTLAALASLAGSQIADGRGGGGGGRRDSGRDHDRDGGGTVGRETQVCFTNRHS